MSASQVPERDVLTILVSEFMTWIVRLKDAVPDHDLFECECRDCSAFRRWMSRKFQDQEVAGT